LIIQHTIQSKLPDLELPISISFEAENFEWKFLNVLLSINKDKKMFSLKQNQAYYTVLSVKPHNLKRFIAEKLQTIG
jgi:hypothetical protein